MEETDAIRSLAALAHGIRLQVFRMLVVAGPTGLTPGAIAEQLEVPGATLSFHLKELTTARLITQERDGRNLIYRAAYDHMNALLGFLTRDIAIFVLLRGRVGGRGDFAALAVLGALYILLPMLAHGAASPLTPLFLPTAGSLLSLAAAWAQGLGLALWARHSLHARS